jgi:hypothetical protein
MSYRIQVHPDAGPLLRTLAPHLVLRIGRTLAEIADAIANGEEPGASELQIDNCVVRFVVDHAHRLLEVLHVEQSDSLSYAPAGASAPA